MRRNRRVDERASARERRADRRRVVVQNTKLTDDCVSAAMLHIRDAFRDQGFLMLVTEEGGLTIPDTEMKSESSDPNDEDGKELGHVSLDFLIAWKFLFPLLANERISHYLSRTWPKLIPDMKDAFIALVVHGPFPEEYCIRIGKQNPSFPRARVAFDRHDNFWD